MSLRHIKRVLLDVRLYTPVHHNNISDIKIDITDNTRKIIPFQAENPLVTLHLIKQGLHKQDSCPDVAKDYCKPRKRRHEVRGKCRFTNSDRHRGWYTGRKSVKPTMQS